MLLFITLIALLVSAWIFTSWLYKPGNFPIRKVELINKLENQKSQELQQVAAKALNGGFFSLNVKAFRAEILSKLPWLKTVSVRKVWPNKLLVSITEHKPVVRWLSTDKDKKSQLKKESRNVELLSSKGFVFEPDLTKEQQKKFNKMALLTGPKSSSEKVLQMCYQINNSLKQMQTSIRQCGMNERRTWLLVLDNGIDLKLGKDNIMQQTERFIRVFSGQLNNYIGSVDYADLRYSNGFSVKWKSDNAVQSKVGEN